MSENQPNTSNQVPIRPPSNAVLNRRNLTRTEAKYIDWNNDVKIRLNNLTDSINSQEGPGGLSSTRDIITVFGVRPPPTVLPLPDSANVGGIWKYYRPVSSPAKFGSSSFSQTPHLTSDIEKQSAASSHLTITSESQTCPNNNPLTSCLKKEKVVNNSKNTASKSANVTFAPDTVIHQRENKPKKLRSPKRNRKARFAHPCCGHFLPPQEEIVSWEFESTGHNNPYTRFTSVWKNPLERSSRETAPQWTIRQKRFKKLLSDISEVHSRYNGLPNSQKSRCITTEIFPRYIMALDISLMDEDLVHVHRLVQTMMTTVRVLQVTLHDDFFLPSGKPRPMPMISPEGCEYLADLGPVICALNRISEDKARQDNDFLSIEPVLIKLQLEMFSLVICPIKSLMFRCIIAVIPHTITRVAQLVNEVNAQEKPGYFIKWVNNSVMHRDYMAILKDFGMADENGSKSDIPPLVISNSLLECRLRPATADSALKKSKSKY